MIKQPFTEQQLSELFARMTPTVQMPPATSKRIKRRVLAEARKLRQMRRRLHLRRRVAGVVVALVLFVLAAGSADAQVWCDPCNFVYMPLVVSP